MPTGTNVTVVKDLSPTLAKRLSAKIADVVVKLDDNQSNLRKLLVRKSFQAERFERGIDLPKLRLAHLVVGKQVNLFLV